MKAALSISGYIFVLCLVLFQVTACSKQESVGRSLAASEPVVQSTTKLLATIAEKELTSTPSAHSGASQVVFSNTGNNVAYVIGTEGAFKVVIDGKPGKVYQQIDYIKFSPDGKRLMYSAQMNNKWCLVVDGKEGDFFDAVGRPRFSKDGKHVLYDVQEGDNWRIIVDKTKGELYKSYYDKTFSNDSSRIYAIENQEQENGPRKMVVFDLSLKRLSNKEIQADSIVYNKDQSRVAMVSGRPGSRRLVVYDFDKAKIVHEGALYESVGNQAFAADGIAVSYVAVKNGERFLVVNGKEAVAIPEGEIMETVRISPDLRSIGLILKDDKGYYMYHAAHGKGTKGKHYDEAAFLVFGRDSYAYAARNGKRMFYVVNGNETAAYDKVMPPVMSPDGKHVVCRVRMDGKRYIVVLDLKGNIESQHQSYEMVFDPTFTADGKSVAYGVKDGNKLFWKVEKL